MISPVLVETLAIQLYLSSITKKLDDSAIGDIVNFAQANGLFALGELHYTVLQCMVSRIRGMSEVNPEVDLNTLPDTVMIASSLFNAVIIGITVDMLERKQQNMVEDINPYFSNLDFKLPDMNIPIK
jgi:hypothetical protein